MNPVLKTYPDGSELTLGMLGVAMLASAIGGTIIFSIELARDKRMMKKVRKNYN